MINSLRQSPTRKLIALGALLAWGVTAAQAQDLAEPADGETPPVAIVHGLSANDLLNVRATASPIGLVLARVPNGTMLTRLDCSTSRTVEWCRVEVPDLGGLVGWTPARYLRFARADGETVEEAPAPPPAPPVIDPSKITVGILPEPLPMPEDPLADLAAAATPGLQTALLAPAGDGPAVFDAARETQKIDGAAADLALAYATRSDPAASEVYSALGSEAEPGLTDETDASGTVAAPTAMPVPSPRPPREVAPEIAADMAVAALPSSEAALPVGPAAAPVSAEPDRPAADGPETVEPVREAEPAPPAPVAAVPAPEPPAAARPETPVAPETTVALALPVGEPEDLVPATVPPTAAPTAAIDPRPAASPPLAIPSPEPVAARDGSGAADRTLREQLAALLPSWSRPAARDATLAQPALPESAMPEPGVGPQPQADARGPADLREDGGDGLPQAAGNATTPAPVIVPPVASPPVPVAAAAVPPPPVASPPIPVAAVPQTPAVPATIPPPAVAPAAAPPFPVATAAPAPAASAPIPANPVAPAPVGKTRPAELVAQAQPAAAPAATAGRPAEIPCARYVGQPMTRCEARILRLGADDADVTVLWPDGGERLIRFRGGQPDGTNTRGEFRFTREAELNLIRIGSGERFEILDALPFSE